jgi:hypothetical protein
MAYRYFDEGRPVNAASGINFLLGLWLIVSPWVFGFVPGSGSMWNSVLVGILVAVIATIRQGGAGTISWLNVALGAWMVASPWVFAYTVNGDRTWNSIITGAFILVLGWVSATTAVARAFRDADEVPYRDSAYRDLGYEPAPWYARYPHEWPGAGPIPGEHRGRGPKGYRRPDDQIAAEISQRMADDPRLDARDIDVKVAGGEVTLEGSVSSRAARRLAEEICDSVSGVHDVKNALTVPRAAAEGPRRVA